MSKQGKRETGLEIRFAELAQIYEVSLDLLKKARNRDELYEALLEEYHRRFSEIPSARIDANLENYTDPEQREKVRGLIMFAQQADLIKENAEMHENLQAQNEQLSSLTRKLRRANKELKQLNSHYLNMLGFVSHELRSPLISILGFAELLEEGMLGSLNVEQRNSVEIIIRVSRNLIDMIKNYLDLAKIENGELLIHWKKLDVVGEVIRPTLVELEGQLAARNMQIVEKAALTLLAEFVLEGDPELLRVVFINIFSNAVKYGRAGTSIVYHLVDLGDRLYFSVKNEGPGLSPSQLAKVFDKFSQNLTGQPDTPRGTGLGLFNTRCIVEAHGGTIWAEAEEGKWFKVCFTLPKETRKKRRRIKLSTGAKKAGLQVGQRNG